MRTLPELIAKARSAPGKLNYASGGIGAATFIVTEVLKAQAGIDLVHIPYAGGGQRSPRSSRARRTSTDRLMPPPSPSSTTESSSVSR